VESQLHKFTNKENTVEDSLKLLNINLIEAIPLCDIIEVYINIYLRLYATIFHNSE